LEALVVVRHSIQFFLVCAGLAVFIMQREVLIALKVLGRMLAILVAAILSVVAVQRLVLKLYTDIGKRYILVENNQEDA